MPAFHPTKEELKAQETAWRFGERIDGSQPESLHHMVIWEYARQSDFICDLMDQLGKVLTKLQREVLMTTGSAVTPMQIVANLLMTGGATPVSRKGIGDTEHCRAAFELAHQCLDLTGTSMPLLCSMAFPGFSWGEATRDDPKLHQAGQLCPFVVSDGNRSLEVIRFNSGTDVQVTHASAPRLSLNSVTEQFYRFLECQKRPIQCPVLVCVIPEETTAGALISHAARSVCNVVFSGTDSGEKQIKTYRGSLEYQLKCVSLQARSDDLECFMNSGFQVVIVPDNADAVRDVSALYLAIATEDLHNRPPTTLLERRRACQMLKDLSAYRTYNAGFSLGDFDSGSKDKGSKWDPSYESHAAWRERAGVAPRHFDELFPLIKGELPQPSEVMQKLEKQARIEQLKGRKRHS